MKILFDDKVKAATIASLNESINYPASNLQHAFLRKRYQSAIDTDTITIVLAAASTISDFWYGYTNATALELRLYDAGTALLHTEVIAAPVAGVDHVSFAAVPLVAYAELDIDGPDPVWMGGVGLGVATLMPYVVADWDEPYIDNSVAQSSPAGQSLQNYVEPLRAYEWTLMDMSRTETNTYMALINSLGIGRPFWSDPFEDTHTLVEPLYSVFVEILKPQKNEETYSCRLYVREAR